MEVANKTTISTWKASDSKRNTVESKRKRVCGNQGEVKHDADNPRLGVCAADLTTQVHKAHCPPMPQAPLTPQVHEAHPPMPQAPLTPQVHEAHFPPVPQAPLTPQVHEAHCPPAPHAQSNNSSHIPFGNTGDEFVTGSYVSSKKILRDKKAKARDSEGIELLREIFSNKSDRKLNIIHTNYLKKKYSNRTSDLDQDANLQAKEVETRNASQMARRCQARQKRVDHAHDADRADDHDIPAHTLHRTYNCCRRKDRELTDTEELDEHL
jgi:hypothetical protein